MRWTFRDRLLLGKKIKGGSLREGGSFAGPPREAGGFLGEVSNTINLLCLSAFRIKQSVKNESVIKRRLTVCEGSRFCRF